MNEMMMEELSTLAESVDVEYKAAQGRDGKGELPDEFWKSYSAMANGDGGVIWLGIQEKPRGEFHVRGLLEADRVRKAIWDNLNNRKQISINLLTDDKVQPVLVDNRTVLRIEVPRAARQTRPVHLGSNPFGGTYLRRYEGDYLADDESVRRMLAERVEDSRDERVLKGFSFADLDLGTVEAYRNRFAAVKPGHVWTDLAVPDFLERIGAFGKNREEDYSGLRLAGLLMFGRAEVIRDALPNYMVDYQERPEAKADQRWIDRIVPDGSWSGNLYDFFRKSYQKLTSDLKVPFQLQGGQRIEDTPVHEALREALVNTLIHADFSGRVSVLVVKRPDMFGFRNPGLMRIPMELAVAGGTSDCRNRRLQTMFQLVGYGDHAGSGLPKIYHNWAEHHWRRPALYEKREPEQTLMELHMTSLLPPEAVAELEAHMGDEFARRSQLERLTMVTAVVEGHINHTRLQEISTEHPRDISKMLARLVKERLLKSDGVGRGTVYFLPWQDKAEVANFEDEAVKSVIAIPPELSPIPPELSTIPPELSPIPPELSTIPPELSPIPPELSPVAQIPSTAVCYLEWTQLSDTDQQALRQIALPVSGTARVDPEVLRSTIMRLCNRRYLGLRVLADLLARNPDDLRKRTLNLMVHDNLLKQAFPSSHDPRQAYTSSLDTSEENR
jgi:predicted HTH transcriptional regulator